MSYYGGSPYWRETNGSCHGRGLLSVYWQHFENSELKGKQVWTYRVPSASRICILVTGCDSSSGVVGAAALLSAGVACCSVEWLNFTCGAGLRNKKNNQLLGKYFGYSSIRLIKKARCLFFTVQNFREKYINLESRNEEPNENAERMNERKEERTNGRKNESEAYHRSLTLVEIITENFKSKYWGLIFAALSSLGPVSRMPLKLFGPACSSVS